MDFTVVLVCIVERMGVAGAVYGQEHHDTSRHIFERSEHYRYKPVKSVLDRRSDGIQRNEHNIEACNGIVVSNGNGCQDIRLYRLTEAQQ